MKTELKVEGLAEFDKLLAGLPKATAANVLKRAGVAAAQPMVDRQKELVPVETGLERDSIAAVAFMHSDRWLAGKTAYHAARRGGAGAKEAVAALRTAQRETEDTGLKAKIIIGPTGRRAARITHLIEFRVKPFMRPAFDETVNEVVARLGKSLGAEIDKAVTRLAKKAAKKAAVGG